MPRQRFEQILWAETELIRLNKIGISLVSGCKKLANREHRKRHDKVALRVQWEMCTKYGIECTDKWYDQRGLPRT